MIGEEKKKVVVAQLKKDAKFLCDHNGLDYSLLLGIIFEEDVSLTSSGRAEELAIYPHSYRYLVLFGDC